MTIHYIILAHKNPDQLKRLIERLNGQNCFFYVHIDRAADMHPFQETLAGIANLYLVPGEQRYYSPWGGAGIVKATIHLFKQVLSGKKTGYCVLLSGQDYPVKSNDYIHSFLSNNYGTEFINHFPIPADRWPEGGMNRLNEYRIHFSHRRGDFLLYPTIYQTRFYTADNIRNLKKLLAGKKAAHALKLLFPRRFPRYLKPYGGSVWFSLTTGTVLKIIEYLDNHPDYLEYHQYTLSSDEIFFQSIVMEVCKNAPERIAETVTYVNWQKPAVPLPVTFTAEDLPELKALPDNMLFARKFDVNADQEVMEQLDLFISEGR